MDYQLAVFVGRLQPCHISHLEAIRQGLAIADKLLIIIGSSNAAPNIKNPFSYDQRKAMILAALDESEQKRVTFEGVRDYYYNENNWVTEVQNAVAQHSKPMDQIVMLKHYKDSSSYYLNLFPQWDAHLIQNTKVMNATDIRKSLFDPDNLKEVTEWRDKGIDNSAYKGNFLDRTKKMPLNIEHWLMHNFIGTEAHYALIKEYQFIKAYKALWANSPFPPTFVTADAVVIKSGHILLIRRKFEPGKGLYALPGGFIKQTESIEQAAIRELKEETRIDIPKPILHTCIKDMKVFDHPERSLRGRTVTHAYLINLGQGELPAIKASDDALGAQWVPILSLGKLESEFFEDHFSMIHYFVSRS
jgi:bifunctional NMN adenylyltransferase/nudix hydrolase